MVDNATAKVINKLSVAESLFIGDNVFCDNMVNIGLFIARLTSELIFILALKGNYSTKVPITCHYLPLFLHCLQVQSLQVQ